jgi:hypothetical protein
MAFNGTTFNLTTSRLVDPATANLTFTKYEAGSFTFTLSSLIYSTSIGISGASVSGFPNITCTLPVVESDSTASTVTINPGSIRAIQPGSTPMTASTLRYKRVNSITVNGVIKQNGTSIVVGGTTVNIVIDSTTCEIYAF